MAKGAKPRRDELPALKVSRLRGLDLIKVGDPEATIEVGGLTRTVKLWHMHLANGGSWSFFICPNCARKCTTLRQYDGRLMCARCDGLLTSNQAGDPKPRIARLVGLLTTKQAMVKKHPCGHRVRYRKRLEHALRLARVRDRKLRVDTWAKAQEQVRRSIKRASKRSLPKPAAT